MGLTMNEAIIGIDLGGTRLRAARFDRELNLLARDEVLTHAEQGPHETIDRMKLMISEMLPTDGTRVSGIGISAPGPSNPYTGVVVAPPNLPGWIDIPLVKILEDAFGVPVYLGNDANVAALAEVARGSALHARDAIFITVSTGIGGGVVTDGRLLLGREGLGAEVGHMIMIVEGGRVSTLEKEAAGPALARQARARLEGGEASIMRDMVNGDLSLIDGKVVGTAAVQGDQVALSIVQRAGRLLGLGMVTLLHVFNPEYLVFGGGVSNIGELLFAPMRETMRENVISQAYIEGLKVERALLGDNVSLVGAGALVITKGGIEDVTQAMEKLEGE